ncbi:3-hydroxyacyl-CoA dehydrogenase NAD-binding domain-containing protein [Niveispirillum irakense]|uniref:3-hydroxyacyl-CoA dehydrogenase NAD-binding domain-containing protein n=1 Tax=Niveispirillum irakense TaxID=34011 RepID=UPI0004281867|nr:3-hydroxyacyl-CoA dehydrogenase NAD-binding domain-containing protein [Niveispirillum irakense]
MIEVAEKGVRAALADREREAGPAAVQHHLTHWRLAVDEDRVAWLTLDRAGEGTNTLSATVLAELDAMLDRVLGLSPRALVIRSAKKGGFAAGADIRDFRGVTDAAEIETRMKEAHRITDRLAGLTFPTIALIHGHCLGGGLELALACRYRIATPDAKLGFPEVLLGLHPGLGGTLRLPALIDPVTAMTMMLTGKSVPAVKAKRLGLVDAVVEERHAAAAVKAAADGTLKRPATSLKSRLMVLAPARRIIAKRMRAEVEKRAPARHYPAPQRLIDLWEQHGDDIRAMRAAEITSFAGLLAGETAQNLIRVYFLREGLRAAGKGVSDIHHVHVIGAGTMGAEIAAWCAARGKRVTLADLNPKALAKAIGIATEFYDKKLHSSIDRRDALDRLIPDFNGDGVAGADLIIEAAAEKVEIKRKIFADLVPRLKPGAILATNTSSIPLEMLRDGLPDPGQLVGIHFFNPVTKMELVEIVAHDGTAPDVVQRAAAFCGDIGRLPAAVKSAPGFLVNRALTPYLVEAFLLMDEGVKKEVIDRAAEEFGMPMGPVELADRVGLDIGLEVARTLRETFPGEVPDIPAWLETKVKKGEIGRKVRRGLYDYDDKGKPRKGEAGTPPADMADRLILPVLNTCVRLLREGVAPDEETVDAAMIFATGFAPFRGGPLHYARQRGIAEVEATLHRLAATHGARFTPDEGWARLRLGA